MKNSIFVFYLCFLGSCEQKPVPRPVHLLGFEADGHAVEHWQVHDSGRVGDRIYCYYEEGGNRIKDGQEIIFLSKNEIKINIYSRGKLVTSSFVPVTNN